MTSRWSKRERLLRLAWKLRLSVEPSISDDALQNLINRQPATDEQRAFLEAMLRHLGLTPPEDMTFGHAAKAIALAKEDLNRYAIEALNLKDGNIREWEGGYYLIMRIYGDGRLNKMLGQKVTLHRNPGDAKATATPVGKPQTMDPADWLY